MLSDILLAAFAIHVMCTPVFMAKALQYGIRLGGRPEKAADAPIFNIKLPKKRQKRTKEQREAAQMARETMAILNNVDAYDGTGLGQKEIKHGSN